MGTAAEGLDAPTGPAPPTLVVGVGASAGGLEACKGLLRAMPADTGMAFVVVLHLAPTHESYAAEILSLVTPMAVTQIDGRRRAEANHVYIIAPAASLTIGDGVLQPGEAEQVRYSRKPIDAFFCSLAEDQGERAVGVVLSGTGQNGSLGIRDIRSAGGFVIAQDPDTAEFDGMPSSAIATGAVDAVSPPEEMAQVLIEHAAAPSAHHATEPRPSPETAPEGFDAILTLVGNSHGIDLRAYKKGTLMRRTERRMGLSQLSGWQAYLEYLSTHPEELGALYRDMLIGVTRFFRDPEAWDSLASHVVTDLLASHDDSKPLRVWSAGCATGEEPYSLAMILLEQIESTGSPLQLQIYATDVSDENLTFARQGVYPPQIADHVSPERLERFFHRYGENLRIGPRVRDCVTFATHDLLSQPPFSNLDLVSCRNVLIYLEPDAQDHLLELFHFALRPRGLLLLGALETVSRRADLYETISGEHRLCRSLGVSWIDRFKVPGWVSARMAGGRAPLKVANGTRIAQLLDRLVLQRYASACVVVSRSLEILHFYGPTDDYLVRPTGEARLDLLSWARPGLYSKLRLGLAEAVQRDQSTMLTGMRVQRDGASFDVECTVEPVVAVPGADGLFLVAFRDVAQRLETREVLVDGKASEEPLSRQLEAELRDSQQELQITVEQLESASEEYRASHEELISLNEELQSSNEELETSKEELQSLNEELVTINRELEEKNVELQLANADLDNLFMSTAIPTIFLDRELRVRRFTPAVTDVARIVPTDLGRPIEHIKMRIPDESLPGDAQRVMEKLVPREYEVETDDGRWYLRKVLPYRTQDDRIEGVCVSFLDVTARKRATLEAEEARIYAEAIVHAARTPFLVIDANLRVLSTNEAYYGKFRTFEHETIGQSVFDLGNGQWDIPVLRRLLQDVLSKHRQVRDYAVEHDFLNLGWRSMRFNASAMNRPNRPELVLISIEDVTELRNAETTALERAGALANEHQRKDEFLAMLGHELRNPLAALTHGLDLLAMAQDDPARAERTREMMARQTGRIGFLLDQLLDTARVNEGKVEIENEIVDLANVAASAIETVTPRMASASQEFTAALPPAGTVLVLGDATRLVQVVENLLMNATKFVEKNGRIWLTVGATEDDASIVVRDDGAGIGEDLLPHVFDPFTQDPRQLDRAKGGLGLGLALARRLVEMHGGRIEASSAGADRGSEFVVTLPRLRESRSAERPRDPEKRAEPQAQGMRVVVVDDEEDAALSLEELLTLNGVEAKCVHDGTGALALVRTYLPDVVLLDLGLPKMDGYEVARRLRDEHGDSVAIVALTGYDEDAERLRETGFDRHLLKPIDLETLFGTLAELGRRDRDRR